MKINIGHQIKQQQILTPELQQAIKLLQLSSIELEQEILKKISDNPLLELDDDTQLFESLDKDINKNNDVDNDDNTIDEVMVLAHLYANRPNTNAYNETDVSEISDKSTDNLQEYLIWQLNLAKLSESDRIIGLHIINAINDDGFFSGNIKEIQSALPSKISKNKINQILYLIQYFDPVGVGCKNITEYLLFQLDNLRPELTEQIYHIAYDIIKNNLSTLAKHDYKSLCKTYKITQHDLEDIIQLIIKLKTSPNILQEYHPTPLIPDIILEKENGQWSLEINHYYYNVKLNEKNIELLKEQHNNKEQHFLKEKLKAATWFVHCIAERDKSLLLVSKAIVDSQQQFFTCGASELKPLTLKQIAKITKLHESTVSRVVNNKSIQTPRGIFPLKYFFSSHIHLANKPTSSKKVCALIKNLVSSENPQHPLSDQQLANKLKKDYGLTIARRTISKYRDLLGILPSRFRRKLHPKEVT